MAETETKKKTAKAKENRWRKFMNEYVNVFVPVIPGGSNEPLLIILNGRAYPYERGKNHRMKRCVANIYRKSIEAQQIQYMHIAELEQKAQAAIASPAGA